MTGERAAQRLTRASPVGILLVGLTHAGKGNLMREKVEEVIGAIRTHLQADGGDIDLIEVDEQEGIVKVRLKGACIGCPMAQVTLQRGVERMLKEQVPEVQQVVAA